MVLPKITFPRLLKETIDIVSVKSETNTLAGFKACGISLFQPDAVLKKIKHLRTTTVQDHEEAGQQVERAWCDIVVAHLSQMRTESEEASKRGKKLSVPAEKSVSVADLVPTLIDDELELNIIHKTMIWNKIN